MLRWAVNLFVYILQVPAARLLVQMKGVLHMPEMIPLLRINDRDLRQQILTHVREHAYRHRGKMMEVADSVESMGASQCMQIILPLVQDESASLTPQARLYMTHHCNTLCTAWLLVKVRILHVWSLLIDCYMTTLLRMPLTYIKQKVAAHIKVFDK